MCFNKIQHKQKGISTLIGIIIIVAVAVILFGSVFAYQYFAVKFQQNSEFFVSRPKTNQTQNSNTEIAGPALSEVERWKTYKNDKYNYSFRYPDTDKLDIIDYKYCPTCSSEELELIKDSTMFVDNVLPNAFHETLSIEVVDPKVISIRDESEVEKIYALNLRQFVESFRGNKEKNDNALVGDIIETQIDGRMAFQFIYSSRVFTEIKYVLIVLSNPMDNYKTIIKYPINNKGFETILSTFKFTK